MAIYLAGYHLTDLANVSGTAIELVKWEMPEASFSSETISSPPFTQGNRYSSPVPQDATSELVVRFRGATVGNCIEQLDNFIKAINKAVDYASSLTKNTEDEQIPLLVITNDAEGIADLRSWARLIKGYTGPAVIVGDDETPKDIILSVQQKTVTAKFELLLSPYWFDRGFLNAFGYPVPVTDWVHFFYNEPTTSAPNLYSITPGYKLEQGNSPAWFQANFTCINNTIDEAFLALVPNSPIPARRAADNTGVVDTTAVSGYYFARTATTTPTVSAGTHPWDPNFDFSYPNRVIARLKRISGADSTLQIRYAISVGTNATTNYTFGEWVTVPTKTTSAYYFLVDLGVYYQNMIGKALTPLTNTQVQIGLQFRTTSGTFVFGLDYIELIPFVGWTTLRIDNPQNISTFHYSWLSASWPYGGDNPTAPIPWNPGEVYLIPEPIPYTYYTNQDGNDMSEYGRYFGIIPPIPTHQRYRWYHMQQSRRNFRHMKRSDLIALGTSIAFDCYIVGASTHGLLEGI